MQVKDSNTCPHCGGSGTISKVDPANTGKTRRVRCPVCSGTFTIGDTQIKVEGEFYEQVKDVASHFIDKVNESKKDEKEFLLKKKLKTELTNDKFKRLFIVGWFWIGIFLGIGYFLLQIASKDIGWYKFAAIILALPIFFTIVGAFMLKSTSGLKEENFMKLVMLTLKLNFKGINSLTSTKRQDKEKEVE